MTEMVHRLQHQSLDNSIRDFGLRVRYHKNLKNFFFLFFFMFVLIIKLTIIVKNSAFARLHHNLNKYIYLNKIRLEIVIFHKN